MFRLFVIVLLLLPLTSKKEYHREYHSNGVLKAEGWKVGESKEQFWKFYFPSGTIKEQGHFKNDLRVGYWYFYTQDGKLNMEGHYAEGGMAKWWLFYDKNGKINHKCQLKDGIKNGYCLKYVDEELKSAEKFKNGKKIKEWFSFASFKRENKLSDLK